MVRAAAPEDVCAQLSKLQNVIKQEKLTGSSDYINPIDLCNRLNTYIIPEAAVHGFLTFLFLINGYWLALVLNLPLLGWNIKKYVHEVIPAKQAKPILEFKC